MNGGHQRAVIEIGCTGDIKEGPFPQARLTMMIPPFRGDKGSSACRTDRRGDFREAFKAGLAESKPILIDRLLQEFAANRATRGINEIHQGFENVH
jgi:hypothetical protein